MLANKFRSYDNVDILKLNLNVKQNVSVIHVLICMIVMLFPYHYIMFDENSSNKSTKSRFT